MRYIILILGIFLGDDVLKNYIEKNRMEGHEKDILSGKVTVVKHHNKGAILNFMENKPNFVTLSAFLGVAAAAFGLLRGISNHKNNWMKYGLSMILGGGLSNLFDRIKRGYVVDYFILRVKGLKHVIFNLSDIGIILGGLIVMIGSFFQDGD